ncbi:hypothetical protein HJC23_000399 [Cyclotella cryptica]|uniref:HSF-type DNA-binding domain-containing protein n=1 Tax=Cyclotella cryptica TaxID=29204 RepID=A0ABD3PIU2_9STRA|eukprot:CCRYP_014144-RA/>CCRYP_014144-RA protein AED:0.05 eAED:0.05 QI:785/-1/1/1/-1/1/1/160/418
MDNTPSNMSSLPPMQDEIKDEQGTPAQLLFFRQLHSMITNESSNDCIKWLSDNKGFVIPDKEAFCSKVLPRYFGKAKYSSFTRRLKRWGFRRITKGAHSGAYYHDAFHCNMDFDAYDDDLESDISECSPSESSQSLPLKKRMMWSPDSRNLKSPDSANVMCNRNVDIRVMPEIMREINRNKRSERVLSAAETSEAKRGKVGYPSCANGGAATVNVYAANHTYLSSSIDRGFASLRESRSQELPQDHLARLKRQVLEQHMLFSLGYPQSRHSALSDTVDFLHPARRDLSQVATDVLKREIELRRMQALVGPMNSHQVRHLTFADRNEPNISRAAATVGFHHHTDQSRANEYGAIAMGSLRESTSDRGVFSSIRQESLNPFDVTESNVKDKRHYTPNSFRVPIPGLDMIGQAKNPFNRAA